METKQYAQEAKARWGHTDAWKQSQGKTPDLAAMEAIFQGVSLLALGANGERVLVNFLGALEPVLRQGALAAAQADAEAM